MTTADYVIVGAGAAGCVLADRLTAAGNATVLLVEAGSPEPNRNPEVQVPILFPRMFGSAIDWGFQTVPQAGLDGRVIPYPRGKTLGGSTSIHAQLWTRGHRADYDDWARSGCTGWGYADVLPYFERAEADRIQIAGIRYPSPVTPDFLSACARLGYAPADGQPDGYILARATHSHGLRWSNADAYLGAAGSRPNLTTLTDALVRRVLFDGTRAVGVEVETANGVEQLTANREVLLAAGAIGSPQLLQLSGVGPADHLAEHGIALVADAPSVGANLTDHLLVPMAFSARGFDSPGVDAGPEEIERYLADRVGPMDSILSEALVFLRSREELAVPDLEIVLLLGALGMHETTAQHGLSLGVVLLRPESSGTVRLRSADPRDTPLIDPAFLSDRDGADLAATTAGVRAAQRILEEPGFAKWWEKPLTHDALSHDSADIADYIRRTGENIHHPVGTCRMGADPASVLDPALRVRGTTGLRVVDASAIPTPVRAHTHAPVTMLAERASDLIAASAG